ncbi:MAG: hypothetical protein V4492_02620 [Chlamydiota bacterium]
MDSILFIALSGESLPHQNPRAEKQTEKSVAEAPLSQDALPEAAK